MNSPTPAENNLSVEPAAPTSAKGPWSDIEVSAFIRGLLIHGEGKWVAIAKVVETRTSIQCKSKAQKVKNTQPQVWEKFMQRFKENEMKTGDGYTFEHDEDAFISSLIELVKTPGKRSKNKRRSTFNREVETSKEEHHIENSTKITGNTTGEQQLEVADNLLMLANVARDDTSTESTLDNALTNRKKGTAANDAKDYMLTDGSAQSGKGQSEKEDTTKNAAYNDRSTDGSSNDNQNPLESSKIIKPGKVQHDGEMTRLRQKRPSSPASSESNEKKKQKKQSNQATGQGPWTDEEKLAVRKGILFLGIGKWSTISREYLPTRNGVQIKSHAQKLKDYHTREWEQLLWVHENETLEGKMKWLDNFRKTQGVKDDEAHKTVIPRLPQHKNAPQQDICSNDSDHVLESSTMPTDSTECFNVPGIQNISLATLRRLVSRLSTAELAFVVPSREMELRKLKEENASLKCDIEKLKLALKQLTEG